MMVAIRDGRPRGFDPCRRSTSVGLGAQRFPPAVRSDWEGTNHATDVDEQNEIPEMDDLGQRNEDGGGNTIELDNTHDFFLSSITYLPVTFSRKNYTGP